MKASALEGQKTAKSPWIGQKKALSAAQQDATRLCPQDWEEGPKERGLSRQRPWQQAEEYRRASLVNSGAFRCPGETGPAWGANAISPNGAKRIPNEVTASLRRSLQFF